MLPTPSIASNKPDGKKLSLFFPGISSSDAQQGENGMGSAATSPVPVTPIDTKEARRKQMIRDGIILFLTFALAIVYLIFGPAGDFIAGRAFTVRADSRSQERIL